MKTILLPVFQSFIARSILRTDAFRELVAKPDIRLVLIVPDYKADYYREEFGQENVIVESVPVATYASTFSTRMQRLAVWLLPTFFVRYNIAYLREKRRWSTWAAACLINRGLAYVPGVISIFRAIDRRTCDTSGFDMFFERYKPTLAFSPDIFHNTDAHFLHSATRNGVRTIGMVRSWDCTTNKNLLRMVPARLLANNAQVKEELVRFHGVRASDIDVVGFPQYDAYSGAHAVPREAFCEKINVEPSRRIVILAPGGNKITNVGWHYGQIIKDAIADGRLPGELIVLIQNHPQAPADMSRFEGDPLFRDYKLGVVHGGNYRAAEMDQKTIQEVVDSTVHCALIVSVNTSYALDAVLFDKPHVMLAFDGYEQRPWLHSVARYHQEDNMKAFIETGAVKIATSPDTLINSINDYLRDPTIDSAGRQMARQVVVGGADGRAGSRVATAILAMLS